MLWLKELYIQLYYENGGCEPLASDALKVSFVDFISESYSWSFDYRAGLLQYQWKLVF